jgi:formate dehydrogenase subunit delta
VVCHETRTHGSLANQIAGFFAAYPRDQAIDSVADHLNKFWEPRMRAALIGYAKSGGSGLQELVAAAITKIEPRR